MLEILLRTAVHSRAHLRHSEVIVLTATSFSLYCSAELCFVYMFIGIFTLGAGWKTLSCCAGGSDAYKGITTMGLQLSGRCLAMSRHVLARASISSWPVMKTKMSWDGGASCV